MWAVAQTGELTRREAGTWTTIPVKDGWTGARATCVVKDGAGGVWVGTYHGGLLRWRNGQFVSLARSDGLGGDIIRGLLAARNGDLWIALESPACIQRFREASFKTFAQPPGSHAARALVEDPTGNVWFGTQDGFLLRSGEDNLVDETRHTLVPPRPIPTIVGGLGLACLTGTAVLAFFVARSELPPETGPPLSTAQMKPPAALKARNRG